MKRTTLVALALLLACGAGSLTPVAVRAAVELARTGADVERIVAAGRIAMPLAIEGGHAIGRPLLQKVPVIEDVDLRIAIDHNSEGRDWPLEGKPTIEHLLDHIDHAVTVAGIDHVGLGADMYPRTPTPEGLRGAHDYGHITRGLKRRGYSDEAVRKIMGGNFLRVWKRVAR